MFVWGCERRGRDTDEQTASDRPSAQGELSGLHGVRWTGTLCPAGQTLGAPVRSPRACVVAGDTLCSPWFCVCADIEGGLMVFPLGVVSDF